MVEIKFKSIAFDDKNKNWKMDYNKKLLRLCLSKVMYSNPKKSLNCIFEDDKIIHMVNEYIFELLGYEPLEFYKSGSKIPLRCLYDETPKDGTKSDNRKYIQGVIQFHLLRRNQDYLDDFEEELIEECLIKKEDEKSFVVNGEEITDVKKIIKIYMDDYYNTNKIKYVNSTKEDYFMRKVKNGINFYCNNEELSNKLALDKGFPRHLFHKVIYNIPY